MSDHLHSIGLESRKSGTPTSPDRNGVNGHDLHRGLCTSTEGAVKQLADCSATQARRLVEDPDALTPKEDPTDPHNEVKQRFYLISDRCHLLHTRLKQFATSDFSVKRAEELVQLVVPEWKFPLHDLPTEEEFQRGCETHQMPDRETKRAAPFMLSAPTPLLSYEPAYVAALPVWTDYYTVAERYLRTTILEYAAQRGHDLCWEDQKYWLIEAIRWYEMAGTRVPLERREGQVATERDFQRGIERDLPHTPVVPELLGESGVNKEQVVAHRCHQLCEEYRGKLYGTRERRITENREAGRLPLTIVTR